MEGLAAVTARIAQIQSMLAPAAVRPPTAQASAPSSGAGSFADALRMAQQSSAAGTAQLSGTSQLSGMSPLASTAQLSSLAQLTSRAPLPGASPWSPAVQPPVAPGVAGGTRADVAAFKAAWPNGRISSDNLTPIGGGHHLAGPAAPAFERMTAAAARDGVSFGVNDSYRSFEEQVALARKKGLYSQGGLAAAPGTSQHGWGLAVDLALNPKAQAWMRANGPAFGFHEDVPREPWHWTFQGV